MRVGDQLKIRGSGDEEIMSVIEMLGFEKKDLKKFPFQLSGGMARRILIANAMLSKASLIVADEQIEEHTSELQSPCYRVCRLLLEKKTHRRRAQHASSSWPSPHRNTTAAKGFF